MILTNPNILPGLWRQRKGLSKPIVLDNAVFSRELAKEAVETAREPQYFKHPRRAGSGKRDTQIPETSESRERNNTIYQEIDLCRVQKLNAITT